MESKEIIQNINKIYSRFKISPNLRKHQKSVASVGAIICDNWKHNLHDYGIIRDDIIAFLLVHDIGNIIKFKFDPQSLKMLGDEKMNSEYWKQVREEIILKYGNKVKDATKKMLMELNPSKGIKHLIEEMAFSKTDIIAKGNDWPLKISAYSDLRVGPFRIVTLKERIKDLRKRYGGKTRRFDSDGDYLTEAQVNFFYECAYQIESQIMENLNISKEDINNDSIKVYFG